MRQRLSVISTTALNLEHNNGMIIKTSNRNKMNQFKEIFHLKDKYIKLVINFKQ